MSDIEYSVLKNDVIKSFDCINAYWMLLMSYCVACEARSKHRDYDVGVRVVTLMISDQQLNFNFI